MQEATFISRAEECGKHESYTLTASFMSPMEELSKKGLSEHHRREAFYAPANWMDHTFFGGDWPVRSVDFYSPGEEL